MTHPEMARLLIAERQRDLLATADAHRKIRFARRMRKAQAAQPADSVVVPRIPDFVDGSFREDVDVKHVPSNPAVPAARRVA
jgi:hypothetical protein